MHYNGGTWSTMSTSTSNALNGVWGSGPDNAFAVGQAGTILYYSLTSQMKSFSVNKMAIDFSRQDDRDSINMNAKFALPDGVSFDPAKDGVKFNIDGVTIDIPAGSFKGNKKESKYSYDSATGVEPKVSANLDFKKGEVTLVFKKANVDAINNSDGVTVTFSIGSQVGEQTINMYIDALTYPTQH